MRYNLFSSLSGVDYEDEQITKYLKSYLFEVYYNAANYYHVCNQ